MAKSATKAPYNLAKLIIPQTENGKPNLDARWSVSFWVWSEIKNKKVRIIRDYNINQFKTVRERKARASEVIEAVNELLKEGYVIAKDKPLPEITFEPTVDRDNLKLTEAITNYIEENRTSLSPNTIRGYRNLNNVLTEWLEYNAIAGIRLIDFNQDAAKAFFNYLKLERKVDRNGVEEVGVSNKTYNNYHTNLNRIYNALVEDGTIKKKHNPIQKIKRKKKTVSTQHVPYTTDQLREIKKLILMKGDKQLFLFVSFIYYTAARPGRELRLMQVKDILEDTIYIAADRSKVDEGRHASIPPALEELIQEHGLRSYPPDYYVFTRYQEPGLKPVGKEYFWERHRKVLEELGLTDQEYSMYGYKHTGNIQLYQATKDLIAIKEQNGHTSLDQTYNYMVRLGQIRKVEVYRQFPRFGE
ncbi:tyrosine-type recombinase/integrase [Pontibacter toksunensis]|uniref:Tyrosine-type recombinase/integrase n=2 Tax=Pontibacter toksunensis TaxID=1332631 RepID=A0ABW6BUD9_9BACT